MKHKDNDRKADLEIRLIMKQLGLSNIDVICFCKAVQEKYDREKGHHKADITPEDTKRE